MFPGGRWREAMDNFTSVIYIIINMLYPKTGLSFTLITNNHNTHTLVFTTDNSYSNRNDRTNIHKKYEALNSNT
jgi:hypothetical protein